MLSALASRGARTLGRAAVRRRALVSPRVLAATHDHVSAMTRVSSAGAPRFGSTKSNAPRMSGYEDHVAIQEVFGQDLFDNKAMREFLSKDVYKQVCECIDKRKRMSPALADHFAQGLMRWAEERGATHYCHWFQPMTQYFAYKHDSMIKREGDDVITSLTGKMLVMGEPDGSSFPNGGLRDTHMARGHTVWDPSSPCFISSHGTGTTLCIPSVFFSWTGHALDEKTPLLRSVDVMERESIGLLKDLGESSHKQLHINSGIEQEFFLIDKEYYLARPDLVQTGRTLQGAHPPRDQSLDDQYFASFSERFLRAMNEAEVAMWKLGIPQTTRHREVAPGQYEMAPVFNTANKASDQNLMQMDILTKVCEDHDLIALYHEKPFAGVNGSGKHNNWSLGTNKANCLFEPGSKPEDNLPFMTFLAATIRAVHLHGDVLRAAVVGAGNDWRLGANEAPPAIMSVFLGTDVTDAVERFCGRDVPTRDAPTSSMGTNVLPQFTVEPVDRNRTSPFAFTGNRFEFRAVGSSHNPSRSTTFLNTAVADALAHLRAQLAEVTEPGMSKADTQAAFKKILAATFDEHKDVLFLGNNYSAEWAEEAESRGLLNLRTTTDAIDHFDSPKNFELFSKMGVLTEAELEGRINVMREDYVTRIMTEANGLKNLVQTSVLPPAYDTQTRVAGSVIAAESAGASTNDGQREYLNDVVSTLDNVSKALKVLQAAIDERPHELADEARHCNDKIVPAMAEVRKYADALEGMSDAESWSLPTYHEMLFHQS